MTEQAWLNEGDVVLSEFQMQYFNELIDYVTEKKLKEDFDKWCLSKKPTETRD